MSYSPGEERALRDAWVAATEKGAIYYRGAQTVWDAAIAYAATLRQQAARADEATIREVISDLREWGEAGDEQLLVRANRLEAALSAQPAERQGGDREALLYLMQQFDSETWQCPCCGHAEDTATMDSADFLRKYLKDHPAAPVGVPNIDALVNRFLGWPLPATVCADPCVTMQGYQFPRSGTCLLDAVEAKAMLEYVLAAAPSAPQGEG